MLELSIYIILISDMQNWEPTSFILIEKETNRYHPSNTMFVWQKKRGRNNTSSLKVELLFIYYGKQGKAQNHGYPFSSGKEWSWNAHCDRMCTELFPMHRALLRPAVNLPRK